MNLAVKIYKDEESRPEGMPDEWPSAVVELGGSEELPETGGPWALMTAEQYADYRAERQEDYDTWRAGVVDVHSEIERAMEFGKSLLVAFAVRNVEEGLTEEQVAMVAAALKDVQLLLQGGALKTALVAIEGLVPIAGALPQEVIDDFADKIRAYLGV